MKFKCVSKYMYKGSVIMLYWAIQVIYKLYTLILIGEVQTKPQEDHKQSLEFSSQYSIMHFENLSAVCLL